MSKHWTMLLVRLSHVGSMLLMGVHGVGKHVQSNRSSVESIHMETDQMAVSTNLCLCIGGRRMDHCQAIKSHLALYLRSFLLDLRFLTRSDRSSPLMDRSSNRLMYWCDCLSSVDGALRVGSWSRRHFLGDVSRNSCARWTCDSKHWTNDCGTMSITMMRMRGDGHDMR